MSGDDVASMTEAFAKQQGLRSIRMLDKQATIRAITHTQNGEERTKGLLPDGNQVVARQIEMVEVHETGDFAKRIKEKEVKPLLQTISLAKLQETSFRKIFVSPTGKVYDNGPTP